jgi:putative MATE family efflux protein
MATKTSRFDRSLVEGPIGTAVWKLAWPSVLQNMIGGLQGVVDHALVGHLVGFAGNAGIGVAFQIFLVVMVFIASIFTGMGVLIARYTGANNEEAVNRTAVQAFITAVALCLGFLAPVGYFLAPHLLGIVNAAPEVQAQALPFLRIMFVFGLGMMLFFMLGGALRSAGDARTPLKLGIGLTALNIALNVILIRGLGPIPSFGTKGAAMGTVTAGALVSLYALVKLFGGRWVIDFRGQSWKPDWAIIKSLFRFGLPTGLQGIAMNVAGVMLLRFLGSVAQSAEAQAAYAVGYTELFSLVTWTSVGLMGATAALAGQNLGAGHPERSVRAVRTAAWYGVAIATVVGLLFLLVPHALFGFFGLNQPGVLGIGIQLLRYLSVSGLFITVALTYTGGLQGTGDTKSPLYISLVSQFLIPIGLLSILQSMRPLVPSDVWMAIVIGHATRCTLSVLRFRQGQWRRIAVPVEPPAG